MARSGSMRVAAMCAALVVLTLVGFGGAAVNGFVAYEDGVYVAANEHVRSGLRGDSVAWAFTPDYANACYNLANALLVAGRLPEAIEQYGVALRLRPDDANAHNNLAIALNRSGRRDEAIEQYREALRIRPDFEAAATNLRKLETAGASR